MNPQEQARRYREQMGDESADRQELLSKETCSTCGYRRGLHHPACAAGRRAEAAKARREAKAHIKR